jgi:hypothetical protein
MTDDRLARRLSDGNQGFVTNVHHPEGTGRCYRASSKAARGSRASLQSQQNVTLTNRFPYGQYSTTPTPDVSSVNSSLPKYLPSVPNSRTTSPPTLPPLKQHTTLPSTRLPLLPLSSPTMDLPLLPKRLSPRRKLLSLDHSKIRHRVTRSTPPGDNRNT